MLFFLFFFFSISSTFVYILKKVSSSLYFRFGAIAQRQKLRSYPLDLGSILPTVYEGRFVMSHKCTSARHPGDSVAPAHPAGALAGFCERGRDEE